MRRSAAEMSSTSTCRVAFGDACRFRDAAHDPGGGVAVELATVVAVQDRALEAFPDDQVDGPGSSWGKWHRHGLAALAEHGECAVPAFERKILDPCSDRFGDTQPVQREQRDQRVIACPRETGSDQHRAELVAIETDRV